MLKVVSENILCSCYSMRWEAAFLGFVTLHGPYTNWCSVEETVGIIPAMSMTSARQTDRGSPSLCVIFQQNSLIMIWKYPFSIDHLDQVWWKSMHKLQIYIICLPFCSQTCLKINNKVFSISVFTEKIPNCWQSELKPKTDYATPLIHCGLWHMQS